MQLQSSKKRYGASRAQALERVRKPLEIATAHDYPVLVPIRCEQNDERPLSQRPSARFGPTPAVDLTVTCACVQGFKGVRSGPVVMRRLNWGWYVASDFFRVTALLSYQFAFNRVNK